MQNDYNLSRNNFLLQKFDLNFFLLETAWWNAQVSQSVKLWRWLHWNTFREFLFQRWKSPVGTRPTLRTLVCDLSQQWLPGPRKLQEQIALLLHVILLPQHRAARPVRPQVQLHLHIQKLTSTHSCSAPRTRLNAPWHETTQNSVRAKVDWMETNRTRLHRSLAFRVDPAMRAEGPLSKQEDFRGEHLEEEIVQRMNRQDLVLRMVVSLSPQIQIRVLVVDLMVQKRRRKERSVSNWPDMELCGWL